MDMAWVAAIMRAPVVTPPDPWFVGGTLDVYYYLGHWLMAQPRANRGGSRPGGLQPGPPNRYGGLGRQLLPDRPHPARALPLAPDRAARARQPDGHCPARRRQGTHPGSRPLPPRHPARPDGVPALLDDPRRPARARDGYDQPALPDRAAGLRLDALVRTFVPAAMGADGTLRPLARGDAWNQLMGRPGLRSTRGRHGSPALVAEQGGGRPRCAAGPSLLVRRPSNRARPVPPLPARDPAWLGPRRAAGPGPLRAASRSCWPTDSSSP